MNHLKTPKLFIFALFLCFFAAPCLAEDSPNTIGPSGLPLPRFAATRSDKVNLRTGPGLRFPIEWVLVQKSLPLEIIAEYDVWRRVRDYQGTKGWVHKSTLSGHRSVIVTDKEADLLKNKDSKAPALAHVKEGSIGEILSCDQNWCELTFGDIDGYMEKTAFWGVYEKETIR